MLAAARLVADGANYESPTVSESASDPSRSPGVVPSRRPVPHVVGVGVSSVAPSPPAALPGAPALPAPAPPASLAPAGGALDVAP